jgi:hypothetical protein
MLSIHPNTHETKNTKEVRRNQSKESKIIEDEKNEEMDTYLGFGFQSEKENESEFTLMCLIEKYFHRSSRHYKAKK